MVVGHGPAVEGFSALKTDASFSSSLQAPAKAAVKAPPAKAAVKAPPAKAAAKAAPADESSSEDSSSEEDEAPPCKKPKAGKGCLCVCPKFNHT